jgi:ATP-dependent Clp protease protease subunit
MAKHNLDHVSLFHEYGIHIPTRTIYLESSLENNGSDDGVNYYMASTFFKNMAILEKMNNEQITVILNTCGGDIFQGMMIYDTIKASKARVVIKAMGQASSMGSIILQAGDERVMSAHAFLMFHLGSPETSGLNIYEVLANAKHELEFGNKIDMILYNRIKDKHDKDNKAFTKQKFQDMNFKSKFLTAEETVEMGLADRIE